MQQRYCTSRHGQSSAEHMSDSSGVEVLVVGPVVLDVALPHTHGEPEVRLGGIMHAVRGLWSVGCSFGVAYIAPQYLVPLIESQARFFGARSIQCVGDVTGAPNALLIREPKEYGPQGYDFLLRDHLAISLREDDLAVAVGSESWTDVLLVPAGFPLEPVLTMTGSSTARLSVDVNFEPADWSTLRALGRPVETISISTSSRWFHQSMEGSFARVVAAARGIDARSVLLKENRGGSRFFRLDEGAGAISTPAQIRLVAHSVGVGDCFDAVFACMSAKCGDKAALAYASCIAAEYAATYDPSSFRASARRWLKVAPSTIAQLQGVVLPWEVRPECHIYMAAPDFDDVDTRPLDRVVECLKYHNFTPRLPVREYAQVPHDAPSAERRRTYEADLTLLGECKLLVAVLLYDDPGTLIEIGLAVARGMPVIVYDPYLRARNLMLTESASLVSDDLDAVVGSVFQQAQRVMQQ